MAEKAEGKTTIAASAADVMAVITAFESYPEWSDVKSAEVLETDSEGRGVEVRYSVEAPVLGHAAYTLVYEYEPDDGGCSWTSKDIEGKLKSVSGEYVLEELDEDETEVTYRLAAELAFSVPGFLKKQGEKQIIKTALDGLKKRVERG